MKEVGLQDLVDCIVENHPYAWAWEAKDLRNWIGFFAENGLIIANTVDGEKIAGLVMFRLVMKPEDGCDNNLTYDPEGPVVFLDFTYGPSAEIRRGLIVSVLQRVGRRETVAWQRRGVLRVYPVTRFVCHSLKKGVEV
jgi:hypothetical protein